MKFKDIFNSVSGKFPISSESNKFYLIIVVLLIVFAYLPTLQYDFAYNDQWRAFKYAMLDESASSKALKCFGSRLFFDAQCGRPLLSIGECIEHARVGKISDFSQIRPVMLMIVVLTAFCVGMALSPSVGGIVNGTAIGALFVLSPGYAHMYYLGMSAMMMLIALILATLSYIFIRQIIIGNFHKSKLLLSSIFFLLACMSYPAWAFVVFIFSLMDFLFFAGFEWNTRLKHLFIKIFFFTAMSIIYYLAIKLIIVFLPAYSIGGYEFSANFNPVYLGKRFVLAVLFYLAQPPLNTLFDSLRIWNILFPVFAIVICSFLFFKNNHYKPTSSLLKYFFIIFICFSLIFISIAPWLVSKMPLPGNRCFVTFSLLMCALAGWIVYIVSTRLFRAKKYISTILICFIVLLPASAIQNKRAAMEVGIKGAEIEAMQSIVHNWIDRDSFTTKRYIVVVKSKRSRPLLYDRVLNNVAHPGQLISSDDQQKLLLETFKKRNDHDPIWTRLNRMLRLAGYGESLEFSGDTDNYFKMFTALIREKCDSHHQLSLMNIYNLSFAQERAEKILDAGSSNIVFIVVNQGDSIKTKYEILEINFSQITNLPEPLRVEKMVRS